MMRRKSINIILFLTILAVVAVMFVSRSQKSREDGIEKFSSGQQVSFDQMRHVQQNDRIIVGERYDNNRWQIAAYDYASKEWLSIDQDIEQTNQEVSMDGTVFAWQAWDNDRLAEGWEIYVFDGNETIRVTDNDSADVHPVVYRQFVAWEGRDPREGDWDIYVYDILTKETHNVSDDQDKDDRLTLHDSVLSWRSRGNTTLQRNFDLDTLK